MNTLTVVVFISDYIFNSSGSFVVTDETSDFPLHSTKVLVIVPAC